MPRARTTKPYNQTAAIPEDTGSGCFSGFMLVPLTVILISALLGNFALKKTHPLPIIAMDAMPDSTSLKLSPIFTREVLYWADSIVRWASASNLDPNLVATIMQIESCGDPRATSSAGAMGLFQVMPFHFAITDDPYNPETNATRGLNYLVRSLTAANGDVRLAMAGYNGGIGVIPRAEWTWHAETKRYVQYGAPIYTDASSGVNPSNALNEWYSKYGASLCNQASQRLGLP
ncbi:MAG TPA: lytic transglycosylase domain-containing protein [Anaerolineales bacterium]|nr:lytic transglycosylase domain-containing protein [Anaerolineales bacterium]HNO93600.1 lytic transglycosylase domain-containing protein [Anaerolineales bacterium]